MGEKAADRKSRHCKPTRAPKKADVAARAEVGSVEMISPHQFKRTSPLAREISPFGTSAAAGEQAARGWESARRPSSVSPPEDEFEADVIPVETYAIDGDHPFWATFSDAGTIAKGHFAKVKKVRAIKTGEEFAVKILDKNFDDNDLDALVREFNLLRELRHFNIIRLFAAYESPRNLYLVMELATGGELMHRLGSSEVKEVYSEDAVKRHTLRILSAVEYMHSKNVAHRDLKPENVLLADQTDLSTIKIVDLGLARTFEARTSMRTICGTHKYLAPELVECDRGISKGYDKAVDMWGVGLLAYIMLHGVNPFARDTQRKTHNAIISCSWSFPVGSYDGKKSTWCSVSAAAEDFIRQLLVRKPAMRMTALEAINHKWFSPSMPPSPGSLVSGDASCSVKEKLSQWNAERLLSKAIKGAYRRLTSPRVSKEIAKVAPDAPDEHEIQPAQPAPHALVQQSVYGC